jgi:hypothetical protein
LAGNGKEGAVALLFPLSGRTFDSPAQLYRRIPLVAGIASRAAGKSEK